MLGKVLLIICLLCILIFIICKCNIAGFDSLLYMNPKYTKVKSSYDGRYYQVLDRHDKYIAANKLAILNKKILILMDRINRDSKLESIMTDAEYKSIVNLYNRYDPDNLQEHIPTIMNTDVAYTLFKGKRIGICLRADMAKKPESVFINDNDLIFVALHELAHVATDDSGHGGLFWNTFRTILDISSKIGIYTPIDYKTKPFKYCDRMLVDYSPLFDY